MEARQRSGEARKRRGESRWRRREAEVRRGKEEEANCCEGEKEEEANRATLHNNHPPWGVGISKRTEEAKTYK